MRRSLALALVAILALGGCRQETKKDGTEAIANAPEAKPGLSVSDGRLVLNAVKGNPGAAYFTLANNAAKSVTLSSIYIDRAGRTEMHETSGGSMAPLKSLDIAPGGRVRFEPGGKHVMVFDLDPAAAPGESVEITLTFADGDKLSAPLMVEGPGGMEHMH